MSHSTHTYSEVWDLDVFFEGGSGSAEFRAHLEKLKEMKRRFEENAVAFYPPQTGEDAALVWKLIDEAKDVMMNLRQAGAFVSCLEAQDMHDRKANALRGEVTTISADFSSVFTKFQQQLSECSEQVWAELLKHEGLKEIAFVLEEWRQKAKDKLSSEEESLIGALAVDGYHGWGQMYDTIVGTMTIEHDGKSYSVGQANNLLSHPDDNTRKAVFEKLEKAWGEKEELFAKTLNHLSGFRLNVYKKRGWEEILKEPLEYNRMKQETLDAMWGAISKHKAPFVEYLNRKAKILGKEKLTWSDLDAPVAKTTSTMSYDEGAAFIQKQFARFGSEMAQFTEKAFEDSWIEAEDRPGKRPGGFCTSFPLSQQSRIFMTYSGTMSNVSTLAHELGHAFHSHALKDMHTLNRNYAMNVAETASTFAEMIVADAAVQEAESKEEKVALIEDKLQRSVAFFMNIHARFLFETRFYEEREKGIVSADKLNELMAEAQKEAYAGAVDEVHPHFWASKLHFYITGVPFYNFPYTFGYLFSLSIYAKALEAGGDYEEKYMALLRDTAVMNVEELAMKHLGEDITKEAFWEKGIRLCIQDAEEFLELTK
ncbi:M3 family oligoendopeptidase [Rossellomorea marisflavi]|uniref:Oligoendopeptidase n=1 Tax=Rossellomorea marisflavi TaxID=189381 RepID=A0A161T3I5_9BACI|nr:M3 family oligoendopeptidase [Rossellomorea marisflavi]KML08117.1 oligoendopeptidase [Rossellomorea marisflavi]KZE47263.1 oligoendopeptidase [Rossellomorea marisflavi]